MKTDDAGRLGALPITAGGVALPRPRAEKSARTSFALSAEGHEAIEWLSEWLGSPKAAFALVRKTFLEETGPFYIIRLSQERDAGVASGGGGSERKHDAPVAVKESLRAERIRRSYVLGARELKRINEVTRQLKYRKRDEHVEGMVAAARQMLEIAYRDQWEKQKQAVEIMEEMFGRICEYESRIRGVLDDDDPIVENLRGLTGMMGELVGRARDAIASGRAIADGQYLPPEFSTGGPRVAKEEKVAGEEEENDGRQ